MPALQIFLNSFTHLFFNVSQYTSDVIGVPCSMNPSIGTPFLSHKTDAISFLEDNVSLKKFGFLDECVFIHCFDCSLVSTFTDETQVPSPVAM
jgi:hypothetical protein